MTMAGVVESGAAASAAAAAPQTPESSATARRLTMSSRPATNGSLHHDDDNDDNPDRPPPLALTGAETTMTTEWTDSIKPAIQNFFYPPPRNPPPQTPYSAAAAAARTIDELLLEQEAQDKEFVTHFWRTYDDIIILSIFTQIGIVFRLAASTWFAFFDNVFSNNSALFVVLPLNSLSCFFMGLLCSGERLMEIIATRFTPPRLQQHVVNNNNSDSDGSEDDDEIADLSPSTPHSGSLFRRRRRNRASTGSSSDGIHRRKQQPKKSYFHGWQPPVHLNSELRDVQLLALERRIRASKCLVLFPVSKQDVDVMEHYFQEGYKRDNEQHDDPLDQHFDLQLTEEHNNDATATTPQQPRRPKRNRLALQQTPAHEVILSPSSTLSMDSGDHDVEQPHGALTSQPQELQAGAAQATDEVVVEQSAQIDQIIQDVHANVTENISRLRRVNLADGWDVGTTPEAMSDDLMLGLRDGFCGALSSFSSWNSAMVSLMRQGQVGEAIVGYMLGIQLPIIAYRFGQHVAVYIFIWRTRRETRRDERRGYGIRVSLNDASERGDDVDHDDESMENGGENGLASPKAEESRLPSVRALATAFFIISLVTESTSISFFRNPQHQLIALSLLFSPLGVLARWRLSRLNAWRPTFPLGTFTSNITACMLSGALGRLLAGDPGQGERIVLVSIIAGFGGTLSSLAAFVVEILAGIDPILFRIDGLFYALSSVFWAIVVGFLLSTDADWADQTT